MVETDDFLALEEEQIEFLSGLCHSCPICFSQLISHRSATTILRLNNCTYTCSNCGAKFYAVSCLRFCPSCSQNWFCPDCGTEWPVGDLIDALNCNELGKEELQ